jgi:hypothetical protein
MRAKCIIHIKEIGAHWREARHLARAGRHDLGQEMDYSAIKEQVIIYVESKRDDKRG